MSLVSGRVDDTDERRQANRAVGVSALGLAVTGVVDLVIALITGSVGLLGDALPNLSDVSTRMVVFLGFRISRRAASERYPYGLERAEDLAGLGVAVVIWASAVFAGIESIHKLLADQGTSHLGAGIAAAALGIMGNQLVARYKLRVGRRIQSATLINDAKHSWLDALSSATALVRRPSADNRPRRDVGRKGASGVARDGFATLAPAPTTSKAAKTRGRGTTRTHRRKYSCHFGGGGMASAYAFTLHANSSGEDYLMPDTAATWPGVPPACPFSGPPGVNSGHPSRLSPGFHRSAFCWSGP